MGKEEAKARAFPAKLIGERLGAKGTPQAKEDRRRHHVGKRTCDVAIVRKRGTGLESARKTASHRRKVMPQLQEAGPRLEAVPVE